MKEVKCFMSVKTKTTRKRQTIIILVLLAAILSAGLFFVVNHQLSLSPTQMLNVPDVQTRLISEDGSTHLFGARVVLEVDRSARNVSDNQLYHEVYVALSSLSYEQISSFDGTTIAREAIENRLSYTFGEDELVGVFFRDFLSGTPLPGSGGAGNNPLLDAILGTGGN